MELWTSLLSSTRIKALYLDVASICQIPTSEGLSWDERANERIIKKHCWYNSCRSRYNVHRRLWKLWTETKRSLGSWETKRSLVTDSPQQRRSGLAHAPARLRPASAPASAQREPSGATSLAPAAGEPLGLERLLRGAARGSEAARPDPPPRVLLPWQRRRRR